MFAKKSILLIAGIVCTHRNHAIGGYGRCWNIIKRCALFGPLLSKATSAKQKCGPKTGQTRKDIYNVETC
jgi:hypothetical protein